MSFNFIPASQVGEAAARADTEQRQHPGRHSPESLTVFPAHSPRGRGHLLVSEGLVSFHPRRGLDMVSVEHGVTVKPARLATQVLLDDGGQRLTVRVAVWERARLLRALQDAGVAVS